MDAHIWVVVATIFARGQRFFLNNCCLVTVTVVNAGRHAVGVVRALRIARGGRPAHVLRLACVHALLMLYRNGICGLPLLS